MRRTVLFLLLLVNGLWFLLTFLLISHGGAEKVQLKAYVLILNLTFFLLALFLIVLLLIEKPSVKARDDAALRLLEEVTRREAESEKLLERLLDNFEGPALLVEEGRVLKANRQARELLEGQPGLPEGEFSWIGGRYFRLERIQIPLSKRRKVELLLLKDVTEERNRLEREAERERLAALGEIASFLSHEIKNSLSILLAYLRMKQLSGGEAVEELRKIEMLVNEFLDYARPLKPSFSRIDLGREFKQAAEKIGIRLELEGEALVEADPFLLPQVLLNLLKNSKEAGASRVRVEVREEGDSVRVDVLDNGRGVPPELGEKVFLPFVTTKKEGSGMGLAFVKKSMLAMGGNITLAPSSEGARFVLYFKR